MDGISKFALSVKPHVAPEPDPTKGLLIRMDQHDYISLTSVANALGTSRGRLSGQLLHLALQEFVDKLYEERKDLAVGMDENGIYKWPFYSPSVARDLDESTQGTFNFHGSDLQEEAS